MVSSPEAEVSIASPAPSTPVRPSVEHSPPNKGLQPTAYSVRSRRRATGRRVRTVAGGADKAPYGNMRTASTVGSMRTGVRVMLRCSGRGWPVMPAPLPGLAASRAQSAHTQQACPSGMDPMDEDQAGPPGARRLRGPLGRCGKPAEERAQPRRLPSVIPDPPESSLP